VGEQLHILKESLVYEVVVLGLSLRRGPASEAAKLYSESDEARRAREVESAARRAAAQANPGAKGRPTKRDRRMLIHHFAKGRTSD
jgi:ribosome-associated heat shock protein Hsp15